LGDSNIILVFFIHAYVPLQHSHVWIAFTGVLGRIFVSPAHHQIHHSADQKHFNCNFGSCLALWDWMFGTLYVPGKGREKLTFGVGAGSFSRSHHHRRTDRSVHPRRRASARYTAEAHHRPAGARTQASLAGLSIARDRAGVTIVTFAIMITRRARPAVFCA
jgi:hypothetical protein